jgi:hypothetical protein
VRPIVGDLSDDVASDITASVGEVSGSAAAELVAEVIDGVTAAIDALGRGPRWLSSLRSLLPTPTTRLSRPAAPGAVGHEILRAEPAAA